MLDDELGDERHERDRPAEPLAEEEDRGQHEDDDDRPAVRAGAGSATFVPVADQAKANAGPLARVTYALDGADVLVLTVEPRAQEGKPAEAPLVFRMSRSR